MYRLSVLSNNAINIQANMASKMSSTSRCLFCNSASHPNNRCNSNMKGRRALLEVTAEFMMSDVIPQFESFHVNELRFIANTYNNGKKFTRVFVNPSHDIIQLTLTKTRLVKDLIYRWESYGCVREKKRDKPPESGDDCPICLEQMTIYTWSSKWLNWEEKSYNRHINYESHLPTDVITLPCDRRHRFCGQCWVNHTNRNARVVYDQNTGIPTDQMCVACPLCRAQTVFSI